MSKAEIEALAKEIYDKTLALNALRADYAGEPCEDYTFTTEAGEVRLSELFGEHDRLLVIHNMGQGCRYCTLWADGINGLLPHLESAMAVVLVSPDAPAAQRTFANSRGWRFRMASHGGHRYAKEQYVMQPGMPAAVAYRRDGQALFRMSETPFGPGDMFCVQFNLLALAGIGSFTPQYRYWSRPGQLLDGGEDVRDG